MLKKMIILGAVIGAAVLLIPAVRGHAVHAFQWAQSEVDEAVPIAYELEQAERDLEQIEPEIRQAREVVAAEEVEIEQLEVELQRLQGQLDRDTVRLQERSEALQDSSARLIVAGRSYSREALACKVKLAQTRHERRSQLLESRQQALMARLKSLEAAREHLRQMVSERDRMRLAIDELRALMRQNQAMETARGTYAFDDSKLADLAKRLERIRKKLRIQRKVIEQSDPLLGSLSEERVDPDAVEESAARYLETLDRESELQPTTR